MKYLKDEDVIRAYEKFKEFQTKSAGLFDSDDGSAYIAGFLAATIIERNTNENQQATN